MLSIPTRSPALSVVDALTLHDWSFEGSDTLENGHGVHPYPAKFPPQIPRQLIEHLTSPGDLVVDPFAGSGTAALEAKRLGRRSYSIDANPVASRLTRLKAVGLTEGEKEQVRGLSQKVLLEMGVFPTCEGACEALAFVPRIPNREKWFADVCVHELAHLRQRIHVLQHAVRDAAELALGQTAAKVSFQESETRYVSKPREVASGEVVRYFARQLCKIADEVRTAEFEEPRSFVFEGDARSSSSWDHLPEGSASLVVTSPPYPNAYDYHLYHRFRILWTGSDPADLRRVEIGSHLRQQSVADPIADYEQDMKLVLEHCLAALRPGGWAVFIVGDGKYKGALYNTGKALGRLGEEVGFEAGGVITRPLPVSRRSVTAFGRRLETEDLVFLQKPDPSVNLRGPHWEMAPYEQELADREFDVLMHREPRDLSRLTFVHGVRTGDVEVATQQGLLELTGSPTRKNSTYATHGIHRYKGKFYPQLGRCLINLSSSPGDLVVDPFAGSGTLPLEASLLGRRYHGIELSPVGAATGNAKVDAMGAREGVLEAASAELIDNLAKPSESIDWSQFAPSTHDELNSWFAPRVLARLSHVLGAINGLTDPVAAELAKVCASNIIREISHQDPTDLRIRRRSEPLTDAPVEDLFLRGWNAAVERIRSAQGALQWSMGKGQVVLGDSTDARNWPTSADGSPATIDAVVTSPPYAAALPYLDTDRLSIAAVFGGSKSDRGELEERLVGSREITKRQTTLWLDRLHSEDTGTLLPSTTVDFLLDLEEAVAHDPTAGFRKKQGPAVLTRYFLSMSEVLRLIAGRLRQGGDTWLVMGDSYTTVGGVKRRIPSSQETAAIAELHGLELIEKLPITVTRDNMKHAKNAITANMLLHFRR